MGGAGAGVVLEGGADGPSSADVPDIDLDLDSASDDAEATHPRSLYDDRNSAHNASRANLANDAELARAAALDPAMAAVLEAAARGEFDEGRATRDSGK